MAVQNEEAVLLKAPKESQNMKTAERGIGPSMHRFSFSKVGVCVCIAFIFSLYNRLTLDIH